MIRRLTWGLLSLATAALLAAPLRAADNDGQEDLDKATEAKLSAEKLEDLNSVIRLAQSALDRGLDEANTDFAKKLMASTLIQRASLYCRPIFEITPPDVRWSNLRVLALTDLERAAKLDDSSPETFFMIGRLQALPGGDRKRGTEALGKAIELAGDDARLKVKALTLRANLSEDNDKRLDDYNEAIKLAPEDAEPLRSRGLYYLLQNKPEQALADLDAAIKIDPKHAYTYEARGITLMLMKKPDEAVEAFNKAVELSPDDAEVFLHRARAEAIKGDTKGALADVDQALKLDPDNAVVLLLRARIHQQLGETKEALADVESALKEKPGLEQALELRAMLSAGAGDYARAISDLEELRKVAPKNQVLLVQLGMLYSAAKKPHRAADTFSVALEEKPDLFLALRGRADANLSIGKQAEAITDYEAALKTQPKDSGVLNNLAWTLATSPDDKLRDGKKAIEMATEAAKLTEYKQAHILSTLAAAYAETGDFDMAIEWSTKAVAAGEGDVKEELEKELSSYKEKKPWRELQSETDAPDEAAALDNAQAPK